MKKKKNMQMNAAPMLSGKAYDPEQYDKKGLAQKMQVVKESIFGFVYVSAMRNAAMQRAFKGS